MTESFSAPAVTVRGPVGGGITLGADPATGHASIECWGGPSGSPRLLVRGVIERSELSRLAAHVLAAPGAEGAFELSARAGDLLRLRHTGGSVVRVTASKAGHVVGVITVDRTRLAHEAGIFADALSAMAAL
jgi:hypothetical protein